MIICASFSQQWNGILPTGFTFEPCRDAMGGVACDAVYASQRTGAALGGVAVFFREGAKLRGRCTVPKADPRTLSAGWTDSVEAVAPRGSAFVPNLQPVRPRRRFRDSAVFSHP
jgi:hypothetical protein